MRHTAVHAEKLERWLSPEITQSIAKASMEVHIPIPVSNVPGRVYAYHGDFIGTIRGGGYATLLDASVERTVQRLRRWARRQYGSQLNAGFASLSDLISEATAGGKAQRIIYNKTGPTGVANVGTSLWRLGAVPAAGAMGAALAGGTTCSSATTGALGPQANPTGGDTLHLTTLISEGTVAANTLLLYDRLWHGAPAMNLNTAQTVTYTTPRYATTTSPGNVAFVEVGGTALAATAHNHTIEYTDQDGNTAVTSQTVAGRSGAIVDTFDHAAGTWTIALAAGDSGIRTITKYTCSAAVATGVMNLVHARPLAWIPQPVANAAVVLDGVRGAFNLVEILTGACLALAEINKPSTTATSYFGHIQLVAG